MITNLDVAHCEQATDRPFDEVVAALNAATGTVEDGFAALVAPAATLSDFERLVCEREGPSGLMRFMTIDHGAWLTRFYDQPTRAVMVVLGNPLVAITILRHDVQIGLNVPVRLYVYEHADGRVRVTYDHPSSLMGNANSQAKQAAIGLDAKLAALVSDITGSGQSPHGARRAGPSHQDELLDEMLEDGFPASDPAASHDFD